MGACARCKYMRDKCTNECEFAPYFPGNDPKKFANVHRLFGASKVSQFLKDLDPSLRQEAVKFMVYEADARLKDPVYGCVRLIDLLQDRIKQIELDLSNAMKQLSIHEQLRREHQNCNSLYDSPLFIREPQQYAAVVAERTQHEMLGIQYRAEEKVFQYQIDMLRRLHGNQFDNPFPEVVKQEQQEPQQQQQMLAAKQFAAVVAAGEQQEMLRMQNEQQRQRIQNQLQEPQQSQGEER
ncbi:hypothetical protein HHK36_030877 [Tetracentron sinense]|uniref:LOB domain-containing protein n=1 Tax=Tetracentron sinense TaxID=13715 RepID=A0A834Y8K9_TETSI|nr:hypothetical protein HHK36_030877 [Tetracentron sinense]